MERGEALTCVPWAREVGGVLLWVSPCVHSVVGLVPLRSSQGRFWKQESGRESFLSQARVTASAWVLS